MNEQGIRALIVDDELGIREGCRKILTEEGFEVTTACDGIEALEIFENDPHYSLALVDLLMPRLGGLELIKRLRALDPDPVSYTHLTLPTSDLV